jgi:hypothetical protein
MSWGTMLLANIDSCFRESQKDFLPMDELVQYLLNREDRPWRELRYGKGIDSHWVARNLAAYKIKPEQIRFADGRRVRGYLRVRFEDAFSRYVPSNRREERTEDTNPQAANLADRAPHHLRGQRRKLSADAVAGIGGALGSLG